MVQMYTYTQKQLNQMFKMYIKLIETEQKRENVSLFFFLLVMEKKWILVGSSSESHILIHMSCVCGKT